MKQGRASCDCTTNYLECAGVCYDEVVECVENTFDPGMGILSKIGIRPKHPNDISCIIDRNQKQVGSNFVEMSGSDLNILRTNVQK